MVYLKKYTATLIILIFSSLFGGEKERKVCAVSNFNPDKYQIIIDVAKSNNINQEYFDIIISIHELKHKELFEKKDVDHFKCSMCKLHYPLERKSSFQRKKYRDLTNKLKNKIDDILKTETNLSIYSKEILQKMLNAVNQSLKEELWDDESKSNKQLYIAELSERLFEKHMYRSDTTDRDITELIKIISPMNKVLGNCMLNSTKLKKSKALTEEISESYKKIECVYCKRISKLSELVKPLQQKIPDYEQLIDLIKPLQVIIK